ncbi:MAG: T9SS type A sorting domain-containing protein [Bacteroidetes bacterium]|nr:T9SS type A sorting domain-containing protein [Bacteroidota bacterium]
MKKTILALILLISSLANAQWVQQYTTQSAIRDVQFINSKIGWACGDNIIYKTTNAGTNWDIQFTDTDWLIQQIHPVDSMVVYADGWFQKILKTTNGGENWITVRNGGVGDNVFEGLYFLNINTGWLCGNQFVLKTIDGAKSFDSIRIPAYLYDIHFRNANEGIVCGEVLTFFRTTNGGSNWTRIPIPSYDGNNFYRMSVVKDTIVYLVGSENKVFRSPDYGLTWDSVGFVNNPNEQIYCSNFPSNDTGYAGGTFGKFFKTTNGGHNWRLENTTSFTGYIRSIYFYNNNTGWLVGNGRIMGTTTGGQTLVFTNTTSLPGDFILHQNYPNPFNPLTRINYELRNTNYVQIKIYNSIGKEIVSLINQKQNEGSYSINFNSGEYNLSSGIYYYLFSIDGEVKQTRKMILLK